MIEAPCYLCNAAIILTAHKLGKNVNGVSLAEKVWNEKSLPEPFVLPMLERHARTAKEIICASGLGDEGDKIAEQMLQKYELEAFER